MENNISYCGPNNVFERVDYKKIDSPFPFSDKGTQDFFDLFLIITIANEIISTKSSISLRVLSSNSPRCKAANLIRDKATREVAEVSTKGRCFLLKDIFAELGGL